jgi:hypothetical protein
LGNLVFPQKDVEENTREPIDPDNGGCRQYIPYGASDDRIGIEEVVPNDGIGERGWKENDEKNQKVEGEIKFHKKGQQFDDDGWEEGNGHANQNGLRPLPVDAIRSFEHGIG